MDHGVREDRIIFTTYLLARAGGIQSLQRAFPKVRFVVGAVDDMLVEEKGSEGDKRKYWDVHPGMGHIGDRYF